MKKQIKVTIYISGKELNRVNGLLKTLRINQNDEKLEVVRVSGFIGLHDIPSLVKKLKKFQSEIK